MLQIHTIVSAPFDENTYIVWLPPRTDAVVIDPGLEPELILEFLRSHCLTVAAVLNTHGHADHIAGNADIKAAFPTAVLHIGAGDEPMLTDADLNLSAPFGMAVTSPPADRLLVEGEVVETAGLRLQVWEIPGHSPGHVVFVVDGQPTVVFGGDVLFRGSVGRSDFPGGSARQLVDGIRAKLFTLPAETIVYPGHGPVTNVGVEMRTNPYLSDDQS
jgi:hydroxyacylglutathione hydrolase